MPQLSDTMTEGTLVKWLVKEGDVIKPNQVVAEVETDKATMEMESFEGGTLMQIMVKEGEKAGVGAALAIVGKAGEKVEKKPESAVSAATQKAHAGVAASAAMSSSKPAPSTGNSSSTAAATVSSRPHDFEPEPESFANIVDHETNANGTRILVSPLAKRIAADLKVDLRTVQGSGPNGRIVQADVLGATGSPTAPAPVLAPVSAKSPPKPSAPSLPARVASGTTEKVTLSKMRQTIATRLQQSKQNIPHFYETIDIDMTASVELRKKLLEMFEKKEGIRISIGDIIAKAVASALKAVPQLNATYDEKSTTTTRYGDVNLGMAVALPDGLIVPVLRNIDQMGFKEIRVKSADLVDRARAQKLKRDEMSGATFTVSNLGLMGIREFSAIVNPPEVGILAIGASEDKAVVREGQVVVRNMMTVTLSCDHRVIDGAVSANFLVTLKKFLEVPALMLM